MERQAEIELRSERLRNIIGRVPPTLVRTGTIITMVATIAIAITICLMPWPMTVRAKGCVTRVGRGKAEIACLVPYKYRYLFDMGHNANVTYEGMPTSPVCGKMTRVENGVVTINDNNFFTIRILCLNDKGSFHTFKGEKADVEIIISDKTVWQQLRGH